MIDNVGFRKKKKQIASVVMIWMIASAFLVVMMPLQTTTVRGQVTHLSSAASEDWTGPPMPPNIYDMDPTVGYVLWDGAEDHIIPNDYMIEPGYTVEVPGRGGGAGMQVEFPNQLVRMNVYGTLITNNDGSIPTKTNFIGTGIQPYGGIFIYAGGSARFVDCYITNSIYGVNFLEGSQMNSPGISQTAFVDNYVSYLTLNSVTGSTSISSNSYFDDRASPGAPLLSVYNTDLTISGTVNFLDHGANMRQLHILDSNVTIDGSTFYNEDQTGSPVLVEGDSGNTVFTNCGFQDGDVGQYYVESTGVSFLMESCSYHTAAGALSVLAQDNATTPASVDVLNPTADGLPGYYDSSFDDTTLTATGTSDIDLQWFKDVYVEDPDGHLIINSPVYIKDTLDNPSSPPVQQTDGTGWAREFVVTEKTIFSGSSTDYNPFNISAENNSMTGYIFPEETINMSMYNTVVVPFNPTPNNPPTVSDIVEPTGVSSGPVSIDFMLNDLDIPDDGNLSITVQFWDPIAGVWKPCTVHPSSDPTTNLNSDTYYTFVWDSNDVKDFPDKYSTDVKIRITPSDKSGPGIMLESLTFTVDNLPPVFTSGPTVTVTNTTAMINWTVGEPADASVGWGLNTFPDSGPPSITDLTDVTYGSTGAMAQSVELTGLMPGRIYTYVLYSADAGGNINDSLELNGDNPYVFETDIYIPLKTGWNMISMAIVITNPAIEEALATIDGNYDAVQWYDASDPADPWKHYVPGKPFGNDLLEVYHDMGLWIHMTADDVLEHNNMIPYPNWPPHTILLKEGWNFVGYNSVASQAVNDAMGSVVFNLVKTYDAWSDMWYSWNGFNGNLVNMDLGRGYWINVPYDQSWDLDYYP